MRTRVNGPLAVSVVQLQEKHRDEILVADRLLHLEVKEEIEHRSPKDPGFFVQHRPPLGSGAIRPWLPGGHDQTRPAPDVRVSTIGPKGGILEGASPSLHRKGWEEIPTFQD